MQYVITCQGCGNSFQLVEEAAMHEDLNETGCLTAPDPLYSIELTGD